MISYDENDRPTFEDVKKLDFCNRSVDSEKAKKELTEIYNRRKIKATPSSISTRAANKSTLNRFKDLAASTLNDDNLPDIHFETDHIVRSLS